MIIALIITLTVLCIAYPSKVTYTAPQKVLLAHEEEPNIVVAPKAKPITKLVPELIPVCACESTGKWNGTPTQFDKNGKVLHGKVNPNDIGMCQINMEARNGHLARTKQLGLDVYTEEGNIAYANYLYSQNGLKDWGWSKHCWKDHNPL